MNTRLLVVITIGLLLTLCPVALFAQSVDSSTPGPVVAQPIQQNAIPQLTISGFVVLALDWLKKNKAVTWITADSEKRNKVAAVIASALAAAAVHWTFDKDAGRLVIDGLNLVGITTGLVAWGKSYVYQQLIFKMSRT